MKFLKSNIVALVALVISIVIVLPLSFRSANQAPQAYQSGNLGGITNYDTLSLGGTLYHGGQLSTTTPASMTLAATDLIGYTTVFMNPTVGSVTVTLPATTTFSGALGTSWIPNPGDQTQVTLINSTSTAATTITLAGGTGTLLQKSTATTTAILPGGSAILSAIRKQNGDIIFSFNPGI